jgi:hypothetical protein
MAQGYPRMLKESVQISNGVVTCWKMYEHVVNFPHHAALLKSCNVLLEAQLHTATLGVEKFAAVHVHCIPWISIINHMNSVTWISESISKPFFVLMN